MCCAVFFESRLTASESHCLHRYFWQIWEITASTDPHPRKLPRWRTDAFFAAAIALNYANRGILPVVFPAMRAELHLSDIAFGLLGSLFFWSYAVCAPVGGILGDRYSRKWLVIASVAGWSITALLCGMATGFVMLAVIRVAFGVAESFYLPAAVALQGSHHEPSTRTFVMGINKAAQSGGVILGAALVGWIAERWGWRSAFVIPGMIGLALALASPWFLSEPPAAPRPKQKRTNPLVDLAFLVRNGTYLAIVSNEMLSAVGNWMLFSWMPLFLYETYGVKMASAGLFGMAMLQLSSILGTVAGTMLARRFPHMGSPLRMRLFAICGLASAPCLLGFLGHPSYTMVAAAVISYSFFRGWGGVYELAILCDVVPPVYRSMAVGLMVAAAMGAGGTGVFVAGFLKQTMGLSGAFASLAGICMLAALGLLLASLKFIRRDLQRMAAFTLAQGESSAGAAH